ncbi:hypothetical protein Murru_1454 [Allomuricauda ruestringensis DSM 13258]|uniref:DUF1963 domain-containing protein n=1 Tax=Allomuricauda ruestringensis (strain DSM 13258 / CIP 107369 / LMG 19739 / B1) TaxID=886377 RepID=G2PQ30_ALLRU|nr:DUF1963 domain-containing protein [Allomuricauda ruestringensis]AEM70495.1 hypothetical protein Murru_1454 [Allomuricauda ruestringensis DSM 13258]
MNKLEKARQAILDYPLKEYFEIIGIEASDYIFSNEHISEGLQFCIDVVNDKVLNESDIPIGSSKSLGAPHLPKIVDLESLKGYDFLVQFNFEELKPCDIFDFFPNKGIVYLFYDFNSVSAKALYFDGDFEQLEVFEKAGDNSKNKFSSQSKRENPSKITFDAGFTFGNWDEREEITKVIPKELKATLSEIFGFSNLDPLRYDFNKEISGSILGKPTFLIDDEGYDNPFLDDYILLYDYCFGDNYLHFWIAPENLKKRDFSRIEVTVSVG